MTNVSSSSSKVRSEAKAELLKAPKEPKVGKVAQRYTPSSSSDILHCAQRTRLSCYTGTNILGSLMH